MAGDSAQDLVCHVICYIISCQCVMPDPVENMRYVMRKRLR